MNQLEQLKKFTRVVADTGDFGSIKEFAPQDATTNPSLILAAAGLERYHSLLDQAVSDFRHSPLTGAQLVDRVSDRILVLFGVEILKIVPGRVSTETDARLAFDYDALVHKGRELIASYAEYKIPSERVLIKIAATWEGIRAAEMLEKEGIHTNLTLIFSFAQAVACAEAKVQLISPFVGRIYDWYKKTEGHDYKPAEDPGVKSTARIYNYYKRFDHKTEVMGASFRTPGQALELAGCDLLTISPKILEQLVASEEKVEQKLFPPSDATSDLVRVDSNEKIFRWELNQDPMATEKLAEGIRLFGADTVKLDTKISQLILG